MNFLSSTFGGSIAKIDALLSKISSIETEYSKDWNEIQTQIDSLEVKIAQTKSDPAEVKKLERMIDRHKKLLVALNKKRKTDIEKADKKAEDITKGNQRLISYWNLKKTELEAEIAEKLYNMAKDLTDDKIADELYDKYKSAALEAKEKDEQFRIKFGKMDLAKEIEQEEPETSDKGSNKEDFSIDKILSMNSVQFTKYVQGFSKGSVKELIRFLITERNERYVLLDKNKEKEEASAPRKPIGFGSKSTPRRKYSEDYKELRKVIMEQIRDLRTKITIARRYA